VFCLEDLVCKVSPKKQIQTTTAASSNETKNTVGH
jgi:hypothetical protein